MKVGDRRNGVPPYVEVYLGWQWDMAPYRVQARDEVTPQRAASATWKQTVGPVEGAGKK